MNDAMQQPEPPQVRWLVVKDGRGEIKGWIECFRVAGTGQYVTIPGASRWKNPDGTIHEITE